MNFGAKERQLLEERFDTRELLDAVDNLDAMRQLLGDSGFGPPEVRTQLLQLHTMLHEASNLGASNVDAAEAFTLYDEISMTLFQMIEQLEQAEEPLGKLRDLFNEMDESLFDE